jgi:hypothetical protein
MALLQHSLVALTSLCFLYLNLNLLSYVGLMILLQHSWFSCNTHGSLAALIGSRSTHWLSQHSWLSRSTHWLSQHSLALALAALMVLSQHSLVLAALIGSRSTHGSLAALIALLQPLRLSNIICYHHPFHIIQHRKTTITTVPLYMLIRISLFESFIYLFYLLF